MEALCQCPTTDDYYFYDNAVDEAAVDFAMCQCPTTDDYYFYASVGFRQKIFHRSCQCPTTDDYYFYIRYADILFYRHLCVSMSYNGRLLFLLNKS